MLQRCSGVPTALQPTFCSCPFFRREHNANMPSKVAVFGSTGEMGQILTVAIAQHGHTATAFVRKEAFDTKKGLLHKLEASGVHVSAVDIEAPTERLIEVLRPFDVVVSVLSGMLFLLLQRCLGVSDMQRGFPASTSSQSCAARCRFWP